MSRRSFHISGILAAFAVLLTAVPALACPFCSAVSQTFSQEIDSSEVAVFAKLVKLPERPIQSAVEVDFNAAPAKATFEVTDVLKGESLLPTKKEIEVLYFGEAPVGTEFLVMGIEPPAVVWSTPIEMTPRSREYVGKLMKLPKEGHERLAFFQDYLEDKEEMLARDAYDEFANAPYKSVKDLKSQMDHDQLIAWIWDSGIAASRKRLYFTMLSVCGDQNDLLMLETILKASDRQVKQGLDAAIACYLSLKGPDGVALVEDLYFKNKEAEYTDTHAAIMALRFHAQEGEVIQKDRIKLAFRHMLEQPKLADLIIPDLARLEDWEVMDRMVKLFKDADSESSWVRVPVVNYLRACPLPEAKAHIEELAKIDPESVQHANSFYPLGNQAGPDAASRAGADAAAAKPSDAAAPAATDSSSTSVAPIPVGETADPVLDPPAPEEDTQSLRSVPPVRPAALTTAVAAASTEPGEDVAPVAPRAPKAPRPDDREADAQAAAQPTAASNPASETPNSGRLSSLAVPAAIGVLVLLVWAFARTSRA